MTVDPSALTPPGKDDLDQALLERYWFGETSPQEAMAVEAWLTAHPEWQAWYGQLRDRLKDGNWVALSDAEVSHTVTQVLANTGIRREHGVHNTPAAGKPVQRTMWYVAAGAVMAMVFLVVGWLSGTHRVTTALSARTLTYATANGERATITLPDGSTASLNVASRLQVPADYAAGNHVVRLTGEALFTVAHHYGAPFTVVAGRSTTRVLGTSFVVRDYATDSMAVVAVREGKVMVGTAAKRSAVVTAAEQVAVGTSGLGAVQPLTATVGSFAVGMLTLNDVSLPAAIPELNRWYDADIRLGDAQLATKRITSDFAAGSLADLTDLLQGIFPVRVVRTGRVLTLYSR